MPQTLTIYLDDAKVALQLKEAALRHDRSVSWVVRMIVEEYLERQEKVSSIAE